MADSDSSPVDSIEQKRSNVRRYVTYAVISVYLALAFVVVLWLMWAGQYAMAIGVLGGVAGIAGSITGFWFGARRQPGQMANQGGSEGPATPHAPADDRTTASR